jgi:hypothetical protein
MGLRTYLNAVRKRKVSFPTGNRTPAVAIPMCVQKGPSTPERALTPQARGPLAVKITRGIYLSSHFT